VKRPVVLFVRALLLTLTFTVVTHGREVKKSDVPEAVLEAFQAAHPKAVPAEYGRETVNGQTRFEIEIRIGERDKDFVYLPDGILLQTEEEIPVDSLPQAIVDAIKKAHRDGEIEEADRITRSELTEYEVSVEVGDVEYELLLSSDGKIMSSKEAGNDEDEPGDVDTNDEEDTDS
jgi:hypothetical protein